MTHLRVILSRLQSKADLTSVECTWDDDSEEEITNLSSIIEQPNFRESKQSHYLINENDQNSCNGGGLVHPTKPLMCIEYDKFHPSTKKNLKCDKLHPSTQKNLGCDELPPSTQKNLVCDRLHPSTQKNLECDELPPSTQKNLECDELPLSIQKNLECDKPLSSTQKNLDSDEHHTEHLSTQNNLKLNRNSKGVGHAEFYQNEKLNRSSNLMSNHTMFPFAAKPCISSQSLKSYHVYEDSCNSMKPNRIESPSQKRSAVTQSVEVPSWFWHEKSDSHFSESRLKSISCISNDCNSDARSSFTLRSYARIDAKINNWLDSELLVINGKFYLPLKLLGKGGSGNVYEVFDLNAMDLKAVKKVDCNGMEPEFSKRLLNEIACLEKLQSCQWVIKLIDYQYIVEKKIIYIVLERGDTDLRSLIKKQALNYMPPLIVKAYWFEMLSAVQQIHQQGIIHNDLKPDNFIMVNGRLKLIDFGVSAAVASDKTSVHLDLVVGTYNYMSPESLLCPENERHIRINRKSDVWSLGCILYSMVYGTTPFASFTTIPHKIAAICSKDYQIKFEPLGDPLLLDVLKRCLTRNRDDRISIDDLLKHPYLCGDN